MTGKWDALIARLEARRPRYNQTSIDGDIGKDIDAAIAALREAQTHVPPPGWIRPERFYHESTGSFVAKIGSDWVAVRVDGRWTDPPAHPTAAAAMAAIEKIGK